VRDYVGTATAKEVDEIQKVANVLIAKGAQR